MFPSVCPVIHPSVVHSSSFTCSSPHSPIYSQFICSLLLYLLTGSFTFLLTYVPTHLPNCPSIRSSSHYPFNLIASCLPNFTCIHRSPPRLLTKQLQLFPEEMGLAFLVFPAVLWSPSGSLPTGISRTSICFGEQTKQGFSKHLGSHSAGGKWSAGGVLGLECYWSSLPSLALTSHPVSTACSPGLHLCEATKAAGARSACGLTAGRLECS